jgi:hypothetical protein
VITLSSLLCSIPWLVGLAPAVDPSQNAVPTGSEEDIGWIMNAPWASAALVITLAVIVLTAGNMLMKRKPGRRRRARPDFDLEVARLENLPVTAIAEAKPGAVHLEGVIISSVGKLGGAEGRECIYRNRVGAGRQGAVGSELIVVRDDTGQVGVEKLEEARVIAPREKPTGVSSRATETYALYIGDRVQVLGDFAAQRYGEDEDPRERVYGMLGGHSQVQLRVLERPTAENGDAEPEPADASESAPDTDPESKTDSESDSDPPAKAET